VQRGQQLEAGVDRLGALDVHDGEHGPAELEVAGRARHAHRSRPLEREQLADARERVADGEVVLDGRLRLAVGRIAAGVRREDREEAAREPAGAGAREVEVTLVRRVRRTSARGSARRCVRRRPGWPSRYGDMVQHEPCSIGRAMEVLGERWTFLIVREAFFGVRRFTELQRNLGIARNILSARLQTLTRAGILEKIRYQQDPSATSTS
jgi:hypothetical protein